PENESSVLDEIGTPEEVAKNILAELDAKNANKGEFTENGYKSAAKDMGSGFQPAIHRNEQTNGDTGNQNQNQTQNQKRSNDMDGGKIALIIIICLLAIPVGIPLAASAFVLIISIFATIFSLIISFAVTAFALAIAGIAVFIIGIANLFTTPFAGLVLIGAGLLLFGLALLFMILTVLICGKLLPAICNGLSSLWRSIFNKKECAA
ncbi:MAG: hypothetical protein GX567_07575, partial [Clostridia bacterium]|nr:hypothetical protein [Clostridia bacterium]